MISETVRGSSEAVLPGITVIILNEEPGIPNRRDPCTRMPFCATLSLDKYKVTGTQEGFEAEVRAGIVLAVA